MENLDKSPEAISGMFSSIASHYDALDHILSFGIDILWRKHMVRQLRGTNAHKVLDLACGTGDLTIELAKNGYAVTGLDITREMLDIAGKKYRRATGKEPSLVLASAAETPFGDSTFDAATISFGIRNFSNRSKCLAEIHRILRPDGTLAILEFAIPRRKTWKNIYLFYFRNILPLIGRLLSGNGSAYKYLPESVLQFPQYEEFCHELQNSGFKDVRYISHMGGIAVLYLASRG
ncbi:MAG: bifunctional demethylmenaquinone methyltransferase/2-methoxy-6-polyprenyl-1,4-benzoquinol methylase UbiE [Bacteroidales bacterium]|nr:bifunctional demethylmenaquinone methyltransferase/2-methoxy-6-polyprenyl-1,4-benzoquinol methylase UbiE [Candidatus Cacconaster equi]